MNHNQISVGEIGDPSDRLNLDWKLTTKSMSVTGICRKAFCIAYAIGNTALTEICSEIKVQEGYNSFKLDFINCRRIL